MPEVNNPVRSRAFEAASSPSARCGLARANAKIFMLVSSL